MSHALYLTDHHLDFNELDATGLHTVFSRSYASDSWQDDLSHFLEKHSFKKISVFVDVMGEEIKHEYIPHINSRDRDLLLKRKLKSMFPTADFTWKQHHGRANSGRRDDHYLMLGVTLPTAVKTALEVLTEANQKVTGIYLLSALQQQLSKVLPAAEQYVIASEVSENKTNQRTFRQTFYKDGVLSLSRLNTLVGNSDHDVKSQLIQEIMRTYQFLASSRQIEQGQKLNIITILDEATASSLVTQNSNNSIQIMHANLQELTQKVKIKAGFSCSTLPELLCTLAMSKGIKPHFQPRELCHEHRNAKVIKGLHFSSAAILLISLIFSAILWQQGNQELDKYQLLSRKFVTIQQQRDALIEQVPETEVPPKLMRQAVDLYQSINDNARKPEHVLEVLARAYYGFHDLDLVEISWVGPDGQSSDNEIETNDDQPSATFSEQLNAPSDYQITLRPDKDLGTREMLARVDSFSASLLQQPEVISVKRIKSAFDTRSSSFIEQSLDNGRTEKESVFSILVTM